MGTSLLQFVGRVGDTVYYYLNKQYVKRRIGKVDLEKRRKAPQYEETRKNQSEFAIASRGGKLFREGLLHFTKGYTIHSYASDVVSILLNTLRSDTTRPKGKKQITNGMKNGPSQLAFSKLNIFCKRETAFYNNTLLRKTNDGKSWRLNRNILFGKGVNGDQMSVKIGYYHVDFEGSVAKYEEVLSIACQRNEKIEFSDFKMPMPKTNNTPWTFIIVQVMREGSIQDITGMTYMSVVDVVENDFLKHTLEETKEPILHKCGLEVEEAMQGFNGLQTRSSVIGTSCKLAPATVMHEHSRYRRDLIMPLKLHGIGGQNDWGEVIEQVLGSKS